MKKSLWRALKFWPNARRKVSRNADIVIAVMGVTGAGKSSFIATVTGRKDIQVGHDLYSETSEVKAYRFSHGSTNYVLVDTPGFDDSTMSNEEVTKKILQWLQLSYRSGTRLSGIIYVHNITKSRMQGSAYKNMRLFRQLCGDDGLGNVILATSFWEQVTPSIGAKRELELKNSKDFWADMLAKGSEVVRIKQDRSVCLHILERIAAKNRVDLLIQREMVVQKKNLEDTTVGENLMSSEIKKFEKTLEEEKKTEKKRLQEKLKEGQETHKRDMTKLRTLQEQGEREAQQRQREAEKEHERRMREDRQKMQQDQREVKEQIRRMETEQRDTVKQTQRLEQEASWYRNRYSHNTNNYSNSYNNSYYNNYNNSYNNSYYNNYSNGYNNSYYNNYSNSYGNLYNLYGLYRSYNPYHLTQLPRSSNPYSYRY